jgi:hypothetical protein
MKKDKQDKNNKKDKKDKQDKNNKKDKKDKKKIKGGFSLFSSTDFYPSAITLNGLSYLSWNNIPIGTLVILTVGNQEICRVVSGPLSNSDPRFGPIYVLIDIKTGQEGTFISYDFRVLVVMYGATIFNTNKRIDNEFFYGIISGISKDTNNLYISGINNTDHLIFNTYNKSDINDNNIRIMTIYDIMEAKNLTGISLDNFMGRIIGHSAEDKILSLKITRNGQWEISNIYKSSQIPNVEVFGGPTQPPFGASGGPTQPQFEAFGGPNAFYGTFGDSRESSPINEQQQSGTGAFGGPKSGSFRTGAFGAPIFEEPAFGGPKSQPSGAGAFGGPKSGSFRTGAFGAPIFEEPAFGGPKSQPSGAGAFGGPKSGPFRTGAFGAPIFEEPAFGGPTSGPFGTGAFGGPKSGPFRTGAFGAPIFEEPAFGGPTSPSFGTGAFGGPTSPSFGTGAFGGPTQPPFGASGFEGFGQGSTPFGQGTGAFGGPTPPPFGASGFEGFGQGSTPFGQGTGAFGGPTPPPFGQGRGAFGGPTPPPFGASGFRGPTPPPFGASGFRGPTPPPFGASGFGGPTPPPFGASGFEGFGQGSTPFGQGRGAFEGSHINYVEMAANIIIKHYFNNAKDLTTTDFKNLSENPGMYANIIKNKMMGNKVYKDTDYKKLDNKAIKALHQDKFDKDLFYNNIINGENKKNITIDILLQAVSIVNNVLNDIRNPKTKTETEANPPPKREPSPQRKPSSPPKREPPQQRKPPPQPNTNPSINDVEVAVNNIIKNFFTDAIYISTEDLLKMFKEPNIFADIIQEKIMGNKRPVDQSVYKKLYNRAMLKLHPDKSVANIEFFHDIINNKNITRENLDDAVDKVYRILALIQNHKSTKGGGKKSLYKEVYKKEILGKNRVIYKISGSNKEYIKNKGQYVLATEYKKSKK